MDCELCVSKLNRIEMIGLNCKHNYCKECWTVYIRTKIDDNNFQHIECPAQVCKTLVSDQAIENLMSDSPALVKE